MHPYDGTYNRNLVELSVSHSSVDADDFHDIVEGILPTVIDDATAEAIMFNVWGAIPTGSRSVEGM